MENLTPRFLLLNESTACISTRNAEETASAQRRETFSILREKNREKRKERRKNKGRRQRANNETEFRNFEKKKKKEKEIKGEKEFRA